MSDLIEALQIFLKYSDNYNPTYCGNEVLVIDLIDVNVVSEEDKKRLKELSFEIDDEHDAFTSYRFGSC